MQRRNFPARQDESAEYEKDEERYSVPSAIEERCRKGQRQGGQTRINQAGDEQPLPILRRPSSPGRPYPFDIGVTVRQARQGLVLEAGKYPGGGKAEPEQ